MMKFVLTKATDVAYWPGDSIRIDGLKESDYRRKSSARLKRVSEYTPSADFEKDLTICFVGSIPKWHLVRCVEMNREDSTKTDVGIIHGLKRYKDDIQTILAGKNKTVENVINSFSVPSMIPRVRLECYRVLSRCLLYMNEKFLTFNSPLSEAIRGEKSIYEAVEELPVTKICCSPSA